MQTADFVLLWACSDDHQPGSDMTQSLTALAILRVEVNNPIHSSDPRDMADLLLVAMVKHFGPPEGTSVFDVMRSDFAPMESTFTDVLNHHSRLIKLHKHNPWNAKWNRAVRIALVEWCDDRGEVLSGEAGKISVTPKGPHTTAMHPVPFPWATSSADGEPPGISPVQRAADIIEAIRLDAMPEAVCAELSGALSRASDWASAASGCPGAEDAAQWAELASLLEGAAIFAADLDLTITWIEDPADG